VIRRLFNVLAWLSVAAFFWCAVVAIILLRMTWRGGSQYFFGYANGAARPVSAWDIAGFAGVVCAAAAVLPTINLILWLRDRRKEQRGFPVLPAHEKTADTSAVQRTSESVKISN
jgi:hypothetical protein